MCKRLNKINDKGFLMTQFATEAPTLPLHMTHGQQKESGTPKKVRFLNRLFAGILPFIPKSWVYSVAKEYVAGESLEEVMEVASRLNQKGASVTIDLLGEYIHTMAEAEISMRGYQTVLELIHKMGLQANISIKLSAFGLLMDSQGCERLVETLLETAQSRGLFVRIDMEDASCTEATLELYLRLKQKFNNVGIVLQAYLRRSHDDAMALVQAQAGHIRLCKGIYLESRWVAYHDPVIINENYLAILEALFSAGAYVGIATHDEKLVWGALKLIRRYKLRRDQYEFQMLYGVDPELRDMLLASNHHVRVYVPFGKQWHGYCMRRFNENPDIIGHVLSAKLRKLR
jgi:proline dehydrogenase